MAKQKLREEECLGYMRSIFCQGLMRLEKVPEQRNGRGAAVYADAFFFDVSDGRSVKQRALIDEAKSPKRHRSKVEVAP